MNTISTEKREELIILIDSILDINRDRLFDIEYLANLSQLIEEGYIFGIYGTNEHYGRSDVFDIIKERAQLFIEELI